MLPWTASSTNAHRAKISLCSILAEYKCGTRKQTLLKPRNIQNSIRLASGATTCFEAALSTSDNFAKAGGSSTFVFKRLLRRRAEFGAMLSTSWLLSRAPTKVVVYGAKETGRRCLPGIKIREKFQDMII